MAVAGTELDEFALNGRRILRRDGRLTLEDGTLAGADIDFPGALRVLVREVGRAAAAGAAHGDGGAGAGARGGRPPRPAGAGAAGGPGASRRRTSRCAGSGGPGEPVWSAEGR